MLKEKGQLYAAPYLVLSSEADIFCRAGRRRRYGKDVRTMNEFAVAWRHGDALLIFFSGF